MANIAVHLAAAQEWAKKHNVDNLDDFLWGAVAPDILGKLTSRSETHYDDLPNSIVDDDMLLRFNSEANIEKFLAKNPIKTDYDKGYLFHLLVDKYFYNDFLKIDRL